MRGEALHVSGLTTSFTAALTLGFLDSDDQLDWRRAAACAHLPQRSVFTRSPSEAEPALRACNHCPIREECETVVDPARTWFDGVSGGRLWRNGRAVVDGRAGL
ncbi:WhiB family transcriptional regulator [Streptomyces sp. NPDC058067]|uniref:WhiB family transcriptional regulator n=1 Tax=Streptomyces sp. NPDC058067 TaxID=3346324 RepID=UPI0036E755E2